MGGSQAGGKTYVRSLYVTISCFIDQLIRSDIFKEEGEAEGKSITARYVLPRIAANLRPWKFAVVLCFGQSLMALFKTKLRYSPTQPTLSLLENLLLEF
jgi:hypothetical protein